MEPMLAGKCSDVRTLSYPLLCSVKLDGVRALVIDGVVYSRKLKPIPNKWVQRTFGKLRTGTDGELIYGDPTKPDAYRNTMSAVMTEDGEPTQVCFHIFDNFKAQGPFENRFATLKDQVRANVFIVPHSIVKTPEEIELLEGIALANGYEGLMVRSLNGPYKHGRSTEREGYLLKVKRFQDAEAVILGSFAWETNTNASMTNALGHTERSSEKAGMVALEALGGFEVRGITGPYTGVEFSVGSGFDGAGSPDGERGRLWQIRNTLVGKIIKYKYFPSGSKDKPRFPTWLGFRDPIDM